MSEANGSRPTRISPAPSPEQAAAVVAALERFWRAGARAGAAPAQADRWREEAVLEGVRRDPQGELPDPWINT